MSPIGRIFIVVNLGLAVAFLGWASANLANSNKYKTWYETEKTAKEKLDTELNARISELLTESNQKENDKNSLTRDKAELDTANARLTSDLAGARQENADLIASLKAMETQLGQMSSDVASATSDAKEALSRAQEAQDARHAAEQAKLAAEERADGLEQDLEGARSQIAQLEVQLNDTNKKLADTTTALQVLEDVTGTEHTEIGQQPLIDGAVIMVSYEIEPGVVLINRGKADNVQRGYSFDVYSGSTYKGRVRVVNVHENTCSAVIEKLYEGRTISQGDSASTQI